MSYARNRVHNASLALCVGQGFEPDLSPPRRMTLKRRKNNSTRPTRAARSRSTRKTRPLTPRQQEERVKCLAAIHRVRRGEAKTVSAAARAEGTTVRAIRKLVPKTIAQGRPGRRIRVTPSDGYSAKVQILTREGALTTAARGSRERELAGQHRATVVRVLAGKEPPSALRRYRGKKVGGHKLISNYRQLSLLAQAGVVGQLESLYVSPDVAA